MDNCLFCESERLVRKAMVNDIYYKACPYCGCESVDANLATVLCLGCKTCAKKSMWPKSLTYTTYYECLDCGATSPESRLSKINF